MNQKKSRHSDPQCVEQFLASLFSDNGFSGDQPFGNAKQATNLQVGLATATSNGEVPAMLEFNVKCTLTKRQQDRYNRFVPQKRRDRTAERLEFGNGPRKRIPKLFIERPTDAKLPSQAIWEIKNEKRTDPAMIAREIGCSLAELELLEREGIPESELPIRFYSKLSLLTGDCSTLQLLGLAAPANFAETDLFQSTFSDTVDTVAKFLSRAALNVNVRLFRHVVTDIAIEYQKYLEDRQCSPTTSNRHLSDKFVINEDQALQMLTKARKKERSDGSQVP